LVTALIGAALAVSGGVALITGTEPAFTALFERPVEGEAGTDSWIVRIVWLLLGIAGAAVQFATSREAAAEGEMPVP
jgi:hypothetical protein